MRRSIASFVSIFGLGLIVFSALVVTTPVQTQVHDLNDSPTTLGVQSPGVAITVESDQLLLSATQRDSLGLRHWPDGLLGFDKDPVTGKNCFYGSNSSGEENGIKSAPARTCGPLNNPTETVTYARKLVTGVKNNDLGYLGAGPTYRDPASGMLIMFYHAEIDYNGVMSDSHGRKGIAVSRDNGMTFRDAGLILTPNINIETARFVLGGGSYLIKDGYFYMYFRDRMQSGRLINMAVARAPVSEVVSAAANYQVTEWKKFYNGSFSEPGIGGQASLLLDENDHFRWVDFVYDNATKQYIGIATRAGGLSADLQSISKPADIVYLTSSDGISWSQRSLIIGPFTNRFILYVSVRAANDNYKELTDDRIYAYYTNAPLPFPPRTNTMWPTAELRLLTLKVTRDNSVTPRPAPSLVVDNNEVDNSDKISSVNPSSLTGETDTVIQATSSGDNIVTNDTAANVIVENASVANMTNDPVDMGNSVEADEQIARNSRTGVLGIFDSMSRVASKTLSVSFLPIALLIAVFVSFKLYKRVRYQQSLHIGKAGIITTVRVDPISNEKDKN